MSHFVVVAFQRGDQSIYSQDCTYVPADISDPYVETKNVLVKFHGTQAEGKYVIVATTDVIKFDPQQVKQITSLEALKELSDSFVRLLPVGILSEFKWSRSP